MYVLIGNDWTRFTIEDVQTGHAGMSVAHVNSDGLPDVASATQAQGDTCKTQGTTGSGKIKVWRNNDSGSFSSMATFDACDPSHVQIVDVDGDAAADIVYAEFTGVYWRRNLGGWSFAAKSPVATGNGPWAQFTAADVDRDGRSDYVVISASENGGAGVYFVNGTNLGTKTLISSTVGGYYSAAGFVTHPDDGLVDLAVGFGSPTNGILEFYRRLSNGTFATEVVKTGYTTARSVAFADLLHNGTRQLVTTSYGLGTVDWWERQ